MKIKEKGCRISRIKNLLFFQIPSLSSSKRPRKSPCLHGFSFLFLETRNATTRNMFISKLQARTAVMDKNQMLPLLKFKVNVDIQYDIYKNTKQVLKSIRTEHTNRLKTELPSQGFIISFLLAHSLKNLNSLWSRAQSKLPANIFNFTIKYLNNTLATRKNLYLWGLSNTSDCSFCLQPESLLHIVAGCKVYLDQGRFTWRHTSALRFLAQTFQSVN